MQYIFRYIAYIERNMSYIFRFMSYIRRIMSYIFRYMSYIFRKLPNCRKKLPKSLELKSILHKKYCLQQRFVAIVGLGLFSESLFFNIFFCLYLWRLGNNTPLLLQAAKRQAVKKPSFFYNFIFQNAYIFVLCQANFEFILIGSKNNRA